MGRTLCALRFSTVVLLFLCTLPSRVSAQQFVCWPIASGDTPSSLARRLTGDAAAAYTFAFQIRDPARQMFVPKSHYQHLQSDWQACVAQGPVPSNLIAYAPVVKLAESMTRLDEPMIAPTPRAVAATPLIVDRTDRTPFDARLAVTVSAGALFLMLVWAVAGSLAPSPVPADVRRAGENFVAVFARPLVDASSKVPPIHARLRFVRRKQQLEISIAPGPGHRYPNLADHKKNVEYDVDRVIRVLGNYVLSKPPRAAGKWVVVTIRPAGGKGQT